MELDRGSKGESLVESSEVRAMGGPGLRRASGGLVGSLRVEGFFSLSTRGESDDMDGMGEWVGWEEPIWLQYSFGGARWANHLRKAMRKRKGMSPGVRKASAECPDGEERK